MAPATPDEGLMSGGEEKSPKARTKRLKRTPTATPRKSSSARNDGDSGGSGNKIFHYFGAGSPDKRTSSKKPATSTPAAGAAGKVPQPVPRVTEPAKTVSPPPAPTWGKLVEPRKQRRWEMLRRLQGGRLGGVDPTAWARRSYSLNYTPVFQDLRTPGMGSNSGWGWASQSQVFGGARACRASPSVPPRERSDETDGEDVPDSVRATVAAGGRSRALQLRNFKAMVAWLSSSHAASAVAVAAPAPAAPGAPFPRAAAAAAAAAAANPTDKTLLEIALERQDGGPATAFMTLMSLAPEALEEEAEEEANEPLALALRLYHGASTWRRMSRDPPPRRQGPGSRLHPNDPGLAAAVDEADDRERRRRAGAEHAGALALLSAGLAVSLRDAGAKGSGGRRGTPGQRDDLEDPDPLVALALREALTASETRALAKVLILGGSSSSLRREPGSSSSSSSSLGGKGKGRGAVVEGKDETCRELEEWLTRPEDAAKRRRRLSRAARLAAEDLAAGRKERDGEGAAAAVVVLRLTDEAREAIHRVHVAFFAAARHGPQDVSIVLREGLDDGVVFAGAAATGVGGHEAKGSSRCVAGKGRKRRAPRVLSCVEAFAEYYRLASLRLPPRGEHGSVPIWVPPLPPKPPSTPRRNGGFGRWEGGSPDDADDDAPSALRYLRAVGAGCHAWGWFDGERQGLRQRLPLLGHTSAGVLPEAERPPASLLAQAGDGSRPQEAVDGRAASLREGASGGIPAASGGIDSRLAGGYDKDLRRRSGTRCGGPGLFIGQRVATGDVGRTGRNGGGGGGHCGASGRDTAAWGVAPPAPASRSTRRPSAPLAQAPTAEAEGSTTASDAARPLVASSGRRHRLHLDDAYQESAFPHRDCGI